ncbi:MAG: hypothetical protein QOC57_492 [Ilumatobacteraceae bacterium]
MTITADERAAMCDLFEELGPDEPTLCEGWSTRDLLAHLLVRERRPDAAGGILIPMLAKRTKQVMASIAEGPFADMVEQFRGGPPLWSPFAIPVVGDKANLVEFFVHHEDIRRAQPQWEPRADDAGRDEALWKVLKLLGRVLYRRSPVGVILRSAGRPDLVVKKGVPSIVVVGLPGEIILHAYGRHVDKVRVVVQGERNDVEAFEGSPRGL